MSVLAPPLPAAPRATEPTRASAARPALYGPRHAPSTSSLGLPVWNYNYFQLLRLIEAGLPHGLRLGLDTLPAQEPLRVLPDPALRYPAADISYFGVASARGDNPPLWHPTWQEMRVTFGGLYGVQSPLPYHFLDDIARHAPGADALASFLDIFNHRLYLLHYQVWKKYRYPQQFLAQAEDRISQCLLGLAGFGLAGSAKQTRVPLAHLLAYIGPFSQRVRNAEGLRGVVASYLDDEAVHIEQLVPHWVSLHSGARLGAGLCLGDNIVLGTRVLDPAGKIRVVIGPMSMQRFVDCMPGGKEFANLTGLIRLYLGEHIEFDLRFAVRTHDLPPIPLQRGGMRLGWTSFLSGQLPPLIHVTVRNAASAAAPEHPHPQPQTPQGAPTQTD